MDGSAWEELKLAADEVWLVVVWIARLIEAMMWISCSWCEMEAVGCWRHVEEDGAAAPSIYTATSRRSCAPMRVAAGEGLETQKNGYRSEEAGKAMEKQEYWWNLTVWTRVEDGVREDRESGVDGEYLRHELVDVLCHEI